MKEICSECGQGFVNAPIVEIQATVTKEVCRRPGCWKYMMSDNYCEDGHARPVGRPLGKRDFPLGGDFDA